MATALPTMLTFPRSVLAPFRSSVDAGVLVPIPIFFPTCVIAELPRVEVPVHSGIAFFVPVPVTPGAESGFAVLRAEESAAAALSSSCVT